VRWPWHVGARHAGGLSASTIGRLKDAWSEEHVRWSRRDLSAKRYIYFWADGIHVQARLEDEAQCLLVIIGATPEGKKELVGLIDGYARAPNPGGRLTLQRDGYLGATTNRPSLNLICVAAKEPPCPPLRNGLIVAVISSPGCRLLEVIPSLTNNPGALPSRIHSLATPFWSFTSTISMTCGMMKLNSFTVPEISIGCAASNIANE
jgi:Transposase, Mutator family